MVLTYTVDVYIQLLQGRSPKPNTRELLQPGSGGGMLEQSSGDCDDEDGCGGSGSGEVKRTLKITNCECMDLAFLSNAWFSNIR